jgi:hypothetical protein
MGTWACFDAAPRSVFTCTLPSSDQPDVDVGSFQYNGTLAPNVCTVLFLFSTVGQQLYGLERDSLLDQALWV